MRYLKKGTTIEKSVEKGGLRIETQCEKGQSKIALGKKSVSKRTHLYMSKFRRGLPQPPSPRCRACNYLNFG